MNSHPIIKLPVAELKAATSGFTKVIPRHTTLPVLGMVHLERDRQGWVHLTATDLDTFLSLRLEAPQQIGEPVKCLVPWPELQKLGKTCLADESLDLEVLAEDNVLLRHQPGGHPVEQVITSAPVGDFPAVPQITSTSVSLDDAARGTLLNALACASDDTTRVILNGAYLDVSKPTGHYAVATDGRHLFASNSLHLALPSSVLIPDHRFIAWNGFVKDGPWKLAVQPPTKDKGGYLRLESRRWTFVTKQIEGTYPNWRTITDDVRQLTGTIQVSEQAAESIVRILAWLPGDEAPNHPVGLYSVSGKLYLRGSHKEAAGDKPMEVSVLGVTISGDPATVYLNRQYLRKALGFGLRTVQVQEPLKPLRFCDGESGSRQMIVMPVRVDAGPATPTNRNPAPTPVSAITPAAVSTDAATDQPTTLNPQPQPPTERNTPPMQNGTNGSGHHAAVSHEPASTEEKNSLEQALDQIEAVKSTLRGAVASLNNLADTLRQVQRERRLSEREIRSVRGTLKALQTVRL